MQEGYLEVVKERVGGQGDHFLTAAAFFASRAAAASAAFLASAASCMGAEGSEQLVKQPKDRSAEVLRQFETGRRVGCIGVVFGGDARTFFSRILAASDSCLA